MINSRDINDLSNDTKQKCQKVLDFAKSKGYAMFLTNTYRDIEYQNALFAQGRTTAGDKVTNAKGGQSYHNCGLAFDVAILDAKTKKTVYTVPKEVVAFAKGLGLVWGGDWTGSPDQPHFQNTEGRSYVDKAFFDKALANYKQERIAMLRAFQLKLTAIGTAMTVTAVVASAGINSLI